jgi:hypothetical protein
MEFADNRSDSWGLITPAEENFGRSFLFRARDRRFKWFLINIHTSKKKS